MKTIDRKNKISVLSMAQVAVCAALLCVSAFIAVPIPILPVPFTLQVLTVILVALILKPSYALAAQVLYTLLGVVGLPVFSVGRGGIGALLSPTGGFIIGFIAAAFFVSLLKGKNDSVFRYIAVSVFIGLPCIYVFGIAFYMIYANADLWKAIVDLTSVFIALDAVKCVIASLLALMLKKALRSSNVGFEN